jgi:hypothetical protein
MLTRAEIEAKLKEDPDWEPDASATDEDWDLYYDVLDSMEFDDGEVVEESVEETEDTDDDWDTDDIGEEWEDY